MTQRCKPQAHQVAGRIGALWAEGLARRVGIVGRERDLHRSDDLEPDRRSVGIELQGRQPQRPERQWTAERQLVARLIVGAEAPFIERRRQPPAAEGGRIGAGRGLQSSRRIEGELARIGLEREVAEPEQRVRTTDLDRYRLRARRQPHGARGCEPVQPCVAVRQQAGRAFGRQCEAAGVLAPGSVARRIGREAVDFHDPVLSQGERIAIDRELAPEAATI